MVEGSGSGTVPAWGIWEGTLKSRVWGVGFTAKEPQEFLLNRLPDPPSADSGLCLRAGLTCMFRWLLPNYGSNHLEGRYKAIIRQQAYSRSCCSESEPERHYPPKAKHLKSIKRHPPLTYCGYYVESPSNTRSLRQKSEGLGSFQYVS